MTTPTPKGSGSPHGYSGKPLFQKLGLKPGMRCLVIDPPEHFDALMSGVAGVQFSQRIRSADIVHLFCRNRRALERRLDRALRSVADPGALWVSWPKKSSPLFKDLTEGTFRELILPTGWVDVKVCAVDADWSALKFLRRKKR
ncbi:MAG: DUF3052 domain-containing protein [Gammaproteobacteria bacterium]